MIATSQHSFIKPKQTLLCTKETETPNDPQLIQARGRKLLKWPTIDSVSVVGQAIQKRYFQLP